MKNTPGKNYALMKVFDCQWDPGMPEDVKKAFFRINQDQHSSNGDFVQYTIADSIWDEEEGRDYELLDKWLIENGARAPKSKNDSGETVLIKYWW